MITHADPKTNNNNPNVRLIEKNILQLNTSTHHQLNSRFSFMNSKFKSFNHRIQTSIHSINPFNQSIQSNGSIQSIESIESIESIKTLETPKTPKSPKNTEFPIPPENPQNRGSPGDPQIWRDGTPYLHRTGPPTPDLHPNSDTPNGTPEFNEFKDFIQTLQFNRFLPIHRIQWNP